MYQVGALTQIAGALARALEHQQAIVIAAQVQAVARSITNPGSRAGALPQVTEALAWAGQYQQAETVARLITNPRTQAIALAQVADGLALSGEARSAARVTAELCAVGTWQTAMMPVLRLVPSAFTALVRILEDR